MKSDNYVKINQIIERAIIGAPYMDHAVRMAVIEAYELGQTVVNDDALDRKHHPWPDSHCEQ